MGPRRSGGRAGGGRRGRRRGREGGWRRRDRVNELERKREREAESPGHRRVTTRSGRPFRHLGALRGLSEWVGLGSELTLVARRSNHPSGLPWARTRLGGPTAKSPVRAALGLDSASVGPRAGP